MIWQHQTGIGPVPEAQNGVGIGSSVLFRCGSGTLCHVDEAFHPLSLFNFSFAVNGSTQVTLGQFRTSSVHVRHTLRYDDVWWVRMSTFPAYECVIRIYYPGLANTVIEVSELYSCGIAVRRSMAVARTIPESVLQESDWFRPGSGTTWNPYSYHLNLTLDFRNRPLTSITWLKNYNIQA